MTAIGATSNSSCTREFTVASTLLITAHALAVVGGNRLPPISFKDIGFSATYIKTHWKALAFVASSVIVGLAALVFYGHEASLSSAISNNKRDEWVVQNQLFTDFLLDQLKRSR